MRMIRGIGEILSEPVAIAPLPAILANPGVELATKDVFAALDRSSARRNQGEAMPPRRQVPHEEAALSAFLAGEPNELEPMAIRLRPVISEVLAVLNALRGCRLARMSGSGPTCFALFEDAAAASAAARDLRMRHPTWWTAATLLGSARALST
jgi:4-diphosphocytidyl-2-C-methyl-D-erythritol kinase